MNDKHLHFETNFLMELIVKISFFKKNLIWQLLKCNKFLNRPFRNIKSDKVDQTSESVKR